MFAWHFVFYSFPIWEKMYFHFLSIPWMCCDSWLQAFQNNYENQFGYSTKTNVPNHSMSGCTEEQHWMNDCRDITWALRLHQPVSEGTWRRKVYDIIVSSGTHIFWTILARIKVPFGSSTEKPQNALQISSVQQLKRQHDFKSGMLWLVEMWFKALCLGN